MLLESIDYSQYERTLQAWKLEKCSFGNINLIVGRNAAGKSRTLNIIYALANLLCGYHKMAYVSGNYKVRFDNKGEKIDYYVRYKNRAITKEKLDINSKNRLNRRVKGEGEIYYAGEDKNMKFQTPENELASVARRDNIQHPFLQNLYDWGDSTLLYRFGTKLGQDQLAVFGKGKGQEKEQKLDIKNQDMVISIFRQGEKKYATRFTKAIIQGMGDIGYKITSVGLERPFDLVIDANIPLAGDVSGLFVQESDLKGKTYQPEMAQGMWRALSLIIHITYSQLSGTQQCILVDDIGEGLDYERSSAIVKLLVKRAKNAPIQLIMTTNDRFVMNTVPLEYWCIIRRTGGICRIYNYKNSAKLFNEFALLGLNNFDFFSSNYYLKS